MGRRRGCKEENLRELEPEERSSGKRKRGVGKRREQGKGGKGRRGCGGKEWRKRRHWGGKVSWGSRRRKEGSKYIASQCFMRLALPRSSSQ